MPKQQGRFPDQIREHAVRMVLDHGHEYGSQWEAICSVSEKLATPNGGPKPETVRLWVAMPNATVAAGPARRPTSSRS